MNILCPAQAFPTPVFRYVFGLTWNSAAFLFWTRLVSRHQSVEIMRVLLDCIEQNRSDPWVRKRTLGTTLKWFGAKLVVTSVSYVRRRHIQLQCLGKIRSDCLPFKCFRWTLFWIAVPTKSTFICDNRNVTEPIGSVSPKVNDGDKTGYMLREQGKPISLLCPAQAYPTPIFRYGLSPLSFEARPLSLILWHFLTPRLADKK